MKKPRITNEDITARALQYAKAVVTLVAAKVRNGRAHELCKARELCGEDVANRIFALVKVSVAILSKVLADEVRNWNNTIVAIHFQARWKWRLMLSYRLSTIPQHPPSLGSWRPPVLEVNWEFPYLFLP
jgi:hypothetical protein